VREEGTVAVRIVYDHRTMDGGTVARALGALEKTFNDELLEEMCRLRDGKGAYPFQESVTVFAAGNTRMEAA
jgi:hypothetical protein